MGKPNMKKDVIMVICVLIAVGALVLAVYAFEKQNKLVKSLEEERYSRMVAEESSQKSAAKLAVLENQLKSTQDKMAKMKDILDQEKSVNSDLKNQYDKLAQTKKDLESKLQSAVVETALSQTAAAPPATVGAQ